MPFCSAGVAPPAFTAPCRNHTGDRDSFWEQWPCRGGCRGKPRDPRLEEEGTMTSSCPVLQFSRRQPFHQLGERGIAPITIGQQRLGDRPGNRQGGIVPGNADLARRFVEIGALV